MTSTKNIRNRSFARPNRAHLNHQLDYVISKRRQRVFGQNFLAARPLSFCLQLAIHDFVSLRAMSEVEFREIAHSGGQVIIRIGPDPQGRRGYQQTWTHQRPVASAIFAVYALAQGVAVCGLPLGGIGSPIPPPPFPGCYMVFIGSDSEGKFGHECPGCRVYWRDEGGTHVCPYCG